MEVIKNKPPRAPLSFTLLLLVLLGVGTYMFLQPKEVVEKVVEKVVEVAPEPPCYCLLNEYTKEICKEEYKWDPLFAISVMYAESSGDPNAININTNGTVDLSLFQINSLWLSEFSLLEIADPIKNIGVAHSIWERSGWAPWYAIGGNRWLDIVRQLETCSYGETE